MVDGSGPLPRVYGRHERATVRPASHPCGARWRHTMALVTVVVAGSLVAACTSEGSPTPTAPTKGMSLATCRPYGVPSAPVNLKLPGMVFSSAVADAVSHGRVPGTSLVAFDQERPDGSVTASVTLFIAPASTAPDGIQEEMWNANITEHGRWEVDIVARGAIIVSPVADTAQATNVSHSTTITTHRGSASATFDYWAFTANRQRYLLSYARTTATKSPDAATFFATATSCAKPT